jgi:glycosyltransferase involved in cell wall biosynthesis
MKQGYFITMYPLSEANEPWDQVYSDIPREVEVMMGLGALKLEPFLKSRRDYYSCIVVSRPHNMRLLQLVLKSHPDWFENIHIVYDAEALFSRRDAKLREISGKPWSEKETQAALAKEIALAESADCVISVSPKESAVFSECGIRNVHVVGHAMDICPDPANFENRSGLLFVGAIHFEASPNGDSIIWFLTDVFPKIQKQLGTSICLTIAGVINSSRIRELAGPCVHFTGHLPSLDELYARARLFVAPTRYSAGLPHKIHEAAARGLPIVATPLLAGQLGWSERELAIGGDADSFAARCVEYYSDPEKWMALRCAALERVAHDCSPEIFEKNVQEVVRDARRT